MAFTVQLYQFAKKTNSTAYPPTSLDPFTFEGVLREGTSVLSPVFGFDFGAGGKNAETTFLGAMPTWAIVAAPFSRCYFITDWAYSDGLWWASMTVDVLATYKINIGGYTGYILRSTNNAAWDRRAVDTTYPAVGGTYSAGTYIPYFWNRWSTTQLTDAPCYIVGVINNATNTLRRGGVAYYLLTEAEMRTLMNQMFSSISYANISTEDVSEAVAKLLLNPTQYIVSCTWFPSTIWASAIGEENLNAMPFGWWTLDGVQCKTISPSTAALIYTFDIDIPKHPSANAYPYTQLSPYSSYTLHIPPWGDIAIDPGLLYGKATISVGLNSDPTGSYASLQLYDENHSIARYDGRIGVDVPLASMTVDQSAKGLAVSQIATVGAQVANTIGGASESQWSALQNQLDNLADKIGAPRISARTVGEEISGTAANIGTALASKYVTVSSSAIASATSVYREDAYLRLDYVNMADTNDAEFGRPALRTKTISDIPGMVKLADPHISLTATKAETLSVNQYMAAGFWYE